MGNCSSYVKAKNCIADTSCVWKGSSCSETSKGEKIAVENAVLITFVVVICILYLIYAPRGRGGGNGGIVLFA